MESTQLHVIGNAISTAFATVVFSSTLDKLSHRHSILIAEQQRFKLWAHSVELHQQGHSSLDYRLRDVVVVKEGLAEVLTDLQGHLDELVAITQGDRGPLYGETALEWQDDDTESLDSESTSTATSSLQSESSFHEVDFRLHSITERIDALFAFASKIRNPRNLPQRSLEQLFQDIPSNQLPAYIQEREKAEAEAILSSIQRQQLPYYGFLNDDGSDDRDKIFSSNKDLTSGDNIPNRHLQDTRWLLYRIGCGNVRRKQQFVYWRKQAQKTIPPSGELERLMISEKPIMDIVMEPAQAAPSNAQVAQLKPVVAQSLFTRLRKRSAAITIKDENGEAIDLKSLKPPASPAAVSHQSRTPPVAPSTAKYVPKPQKDSDRDFSDSHERRMSTSSISFGENLEWPAPPSIPRFVGSYFICPYCHIPCPMEYLSTQAWRVHLIHDLKPYQCTYQKCSDGRRIYGTREEWLEHETQHSLVWHCRLHAVFEEFETESGYILHLRNEHPDAPPELFSDELLANAVAQSSHSRRDCPLCPTSLSTHPELQAHIAYHLEQFALLSLPLLDDNKSRQSNRPILKASGSLVGPKSDQIQKIDAEKLRASEMKIAVAGSGGFAALLVEELSRAAKAVLLLSRAPRPGFEATYGCQVAIVDYHNQDTLQSVLQGVDLVISTISGQEQLTLIDAAHQAQVKTFIPSEFEGSLNQRLNLFDDHFDNHSSAARKRLSECSTGINHQMKYTVFSCGIFYERFGPGGLRAYNMGATCRLSQNDRMIDVGLGKAELPKTNAQGVSVQITLTSAADVARFVAAHVELGDIDTWPTEFRMGGTHATPQEIQQLCSEVRQVEFDVVSRPYSEIISLVHKYHRTDTEANWLAMRHLLQVADGRYTLREADLISHANFKPTGFQQWLQGNWSPPAEMLDRYSRMREATGNVGVGQDEVGIRTSSGALPKLQGTTSLNSP